LSKLSDRFNLIFSRFKSADQEHVFRFWNDLNFTQKKALLDQAEKIDLLLVDQFKILISNESKMSHYVSGTLKPFPVVPLPVTTKQIQEHHNAFVCGEQLLQHGKIGVIIVAGGQGTRLGFDGPKGTFPIGPISNRTIFQYHIEKIIALEKRYDHSIPLYIMTSHGNHQETIRYFKNNRFFGRDENLNIFFQQLELPTLDQNAKFILDQKWRISTSPDGHGGLLNALKYYDLATEMEQRGIEILFYFQVDNVMVRICDPVFLGFHEIHHADMSAKTIRKRDPFEKLGNIGYVGDKIVTIEYTELSKDEKLAQKDGKLLFEQGSIAIHAFSLSFIKRILQDAVKLPYHLAHKKIAYVTKNGTRHKPGRENGIKFEQFIFDTFPYARKVMVVETDRSDFSPLKNKRNEDSPKTARRDLSNLFGSWLEQTGIKVKRSKNGDVSHPVEISPLFAMDRDELKAKLDDYQLNRSFLFTPDLKRK
jgi:UDP-N-acetylglucosamine/UDP-N-acetylgalactosamine diphosphorylase